MVAAEGSGRPVLFSGTHAVAERPAATVDTEALEVTETLRRHSNDDLRIAHLVLKDAWPRALCGAIVIERFGISAPAMDRCVNCLKIAAARGLGRPGWV